ncbi:MAG TPA: hypothetical protein VK021_13375 [Flavobacteriaceae bacterium]|nr:hypothetical protein [Flavobacteriaceae bacterium]
MPNSTATLTIFSFLCCLFLFTNPVQSQSDWINSNQKINEELDYPIYRGCRKHKGNNKKLRACMSRKVSRFINKKINRNLFSVLETRTQFNVTLIIDKNGVFKISEISPDIPFFSEEFIRVIEKLPKTKPGKIENQPVNVKLGLPIIINSAPSKNTNSRK